MDEKFLIYWSLEHNFSILSKLALKDPNPSCKTEAKFGGKWYPCVVIQSLQSKTKEEIQKAEKDFKVFLQQTLTEEAEEDVEGCVRQYASTLKEISSSKNTEISSAKTNKELNNKSKEIRLSANTTQETNLVSKKKDISLNSSNTNQNTTQGTDSTNKTPKVNSAKPNQEINSSSKKELEMCQEQSQKKLTEQLLSKPRKTSPRKRPACSVELIPVHDEPSVSTDWVSRKEFRELYKKFKSLRDRVEVLEKRGQVTSVPLPTNVVTHTQAVPTQAVTTQAVTTQAVPADKPSTGIIQNTTTPVHTPVHNQDSLFNGKTFQELEDSVCHVDTLFNVIHKILLQLFSIEYITSHSVSGQPSNTTIIAKPKFDGRLYDAMTQIVMKKFPKTPKTDITKKVQAVQKKYKKQQN